MAEENERWGYTRITGALSNLGMAVSRSTVRRVLLSSGLSPSPERSRHLPWKRFLTRHWDSLAACDFFTTEIWTGIGLVRYVVFFVMDVSTRRIHIAGIAPLPDGLWMVQIGRHLTDAIDGFLVGKRMLIHDRDPLHTLEFRSILARAGVIPVRLPPKSPKMNAFAERFVLSIKSECMDQMIILGERNLRSVIDEYIAHYHAERNQQGLGNRLIDRTVGSRRGAIERKQRLGGLLNFYQRAA